MCEKRPVKADPQMSQSCMYRPGLLVWHVNLFTAVSKKNEMRSGSAQKHTVYPLCGSLKVLFDAWLESHVLFVGTNSPG